jgi:uncharacterized protein
MPTLYYIDGYNVIHHCAQLGPLARRDFEAARETLIEQLARFCAATGDSATLVFDGRGRRLEPVRPSKAAPGVQIVYAPRDRSADAVIERMAYHAENRRELVVVSADRGIRDLCRGLGTLVMDATNFLRTVEDVLARSRHHLIEHTRQHRQNRLRDRLDPDAIARLEELKNQLGE